MATYSDVIRGLRVFEQYEGEGHYISAEHDIIYAGDIKTDFTDKELRILDETGWWRDEETGCWMRFV